jgi:two-component system, OmpR family, response regulator AdeR
MDILIVEDEPQISDVVAGYLKEEGFAAQICPSYSSAMEWLGSHKPDLALLDVTLPDGSGLDILRWMRDRELPAILLTARGEEVDRIVGLEVGADDYITKPFSPREVVARVRAVLRRARPRGRSGVADREEDVLRIGDLELNVDAHEVRIGGSPSNLTPSEFRLLEALARNAGHALTRAQLLDKLSDDGTIYERTLDRHINNLRRKIEPDVANPSYVLTVYGVGYKMRKP